MGCKHGRHVVFWGRLCVGLVPKSNLRAAADVLYVIECNMRIKAGISKQDGLRIHSRG